MYDILQVKTGLTVPMIVFWKRRPRKHNKSKLTEKLLLDTGEDYMNERWKKVYKAYIFSFPLMMMDATMRVSTNTAEPDDSGKAPANRWMHAKHLASASFRQVVTPNVDTLYSQDEPEGHRSNWLPVSGEGFHLFLRIYRPEDSVFDGNWAAPSIRIR